MLLRTLIFLVISWGSIVQALLDKPAIPPIHRKSFADGTRLEAVALNSQGKHIQISQDLAGKHTAAYIRRMGHDHELLGSSFIPFQHKTDKADQGRKTNSIPSEKKADAIMSKIDSERHKTGESKGEKQTNSHISRSSTDNEFLTRRTSSGIVHRESAVRQSPKGKTLVDDLSFHHIPRKKVQCDPGKTPAVKLGDVINGYKMKNPVGSGSHADSWLASLPGNSSAEVIMKIIRPGCIDIVTMQSLHKECVFARLAKQKVGAQVADCLDVGEIDTNHSKIRFITFEKARGRKLSILAKWVRPPTELQSLNQVFDTIMEIHELIDNLRSNSGVSLWHLDLLLYNMLLYSRGDESSLMAIDYNIAEMCCVDTECTHVVQDLALSLKNIRSHPYDPQELQRLIKPCSSLSSTYKADLDAVLIESWVRNTMALLLEGGVQLADWFSHIDWKRRGIRSIYHRQWSAMCKKAGSACKQLVDDEFAEFRGALGSSEDEIKPEWPASTEVLMHSLHDARDSLTH